MISSFESVILTPSENSYLDSITKPTKVTLLYRATTDGFASTFFHSKCDGKANTVSIVKTNSNFVFGGYTAAMWSNPGSTIFSTDSTAFIFSLRRNGISNSEKFNVKDTSKAILSQNNHGPSFGEGNSDIYINASGLGGHTNFGHSYHLPSGYTYEESNTKSYLAGSYNGWTIAEIEVFQI